MRNVRLNDPNRPVICDVCANAGHAVEMQPDTKINSYLTASSSSGVPDLHTFLCPECESIRFFTVA